MRGLLCVGAMLMASISTSARTWNPGGYGRPQPLRGGNSDYAGAYTRMRNVLGELMPEEEIVPFLNAHPEESRILDEIELSVPEPEELVAATTTVQLLPEQLPSCLAAHPCFAGFFPQTRPGVSVALNAQFLNFSGGGARPRLDRPRLAR